MSRGKYGLLRIRGPDQDKQVEIIPVRHSSPIVTKDTVGLGNKFAILESAMWSEGG